jgi:thiol-disulfide isomerase/thioredoxin
MAMAVLLAAAVGCAATRSDPGPVPFAACPDLSVAPSPAVAGGVPLDGSPPRVALPAEALPCMAGNESVRLSSLRRPAVLNLWASSCAPCREELPALQRFADRVGDRVLLLGVVTGDTRTAAGETATDLGVRFPAVFDDEQLVLRAVGRMALPATLFVDAAGRVRFVYQSGTPLDEVSLAGLVREHLGVTLP